MDDKPGPAPQGNDGWEEISSGQNRSNIQSQGRWATVTRKGAVTCGVETTAVMDRFAQMRSLIPAEGYQVDFRVNKATLEVGVYPTAKSSKSSTTASRTQKKGSPTIHFLMSGVFREVPELAPPGKVRCIIGTATAPDGLPMITIAPLSGTTVVTGSRDTAESGGDAKKKKKDEKGPAKEAGEEGAK
jgi:hypothetical protein